MKANSDSTQKHGSIHPRFAALAEPKPFDKWEFDGDTFQRHDNGTWTVSNPYTALPGVYETAVAAWFATTLDRCDWLNRVLEEAGDRVVTLEDLVVATMDQEEEVPEDRPGDEE